MRIKGAHLWVVECWVGTDSEPMFVFSPFPEVGLKTFVWLFGWLLVKNLFFFFFRSNPWH